MTSVPHPPAPPFLVGASYYPEHVTPARTASDARLMRGAGLTLARMGDFGWHAMEPEDGRFTLDWLVDAVDTLARDGISTLLCTPTAAIPKWMHDRHPDILHVTATGHRKPYGRRRHACLNHAAYRAYSVRIATELARAFADHPHVVGFQVDNELMAEEPDCRCDTCRTKFAAWLERKYGTVDRLNEAWGLSFWSQTLNRFDEVFLPTKGDNPGCFVDYREFASDDTIEFFRLQRDAIQSARPGTHVTHNICSSGFLYLLDLYRLGAGCDFLSVDNYPHTWTLENEYGNRAAQEFTPAMASLALSQIRGAGRGPFRVAEAQIGRTGGIQRRLVEPGLPRLWSHQELAHGAEAVVFFPFRTFAAGHEHMISGIVETDDVPRRKYREVQQLSAELAAVTQRTGRLTPVAGAAVIRDFRCDWAFEEGRISADFRYLRHLFLYYRALREASVTADIVPPDADLDRYPLIVVPAQVLITPDLAARLHQAARRGATLLITCLTGLRDPQMRSLGRMLSPDIEELAGIEITEQQALFAEESTALRWGDESALTRCSLWHDVFETRTARTLATYASRFFAGTPAITRNARGPGTVFYVGTVPEPSIVARVVREAITCAGITPLATTLHPSLEVTEVTGAPGRCVYLVNFAPEPADATLARPMTDLLTREPVATRVTVPARDVKVLVAD